MSNEYYETTSISLTEKGMEIGLGLEDLERVMEGGL
jgi:hypothetical protein